MFIQTTIICQNPKCNRHNVLLQLAFGAMECSFCGKEFSNPEGIKELQRKVISDTNESRRISGSSPMFKLDYN